MAITYDTKNILKEVVAILSSSKHLEKVSSSKVVSVSSESAETAVYAGILNIATTPGTYGAKSDAYDREMYIKLYCNVDCERDEYRIYDIIDSIERTLLEDNSFWATIIDRDIMGIEFDAQEHAPRRVAVVLLKVKFKLACD